ncbi:hypothetical protein HWB92_gp089 [Serratia phage vB_SmaA_3M]|uniref:Uncharacterized protein n=1 Tax=Serratia phage vB_SmaA_3M TaxID=2419930 RepID=A0A3G2YS68_9CAUD|nr:hypothetical protein HWB92_gp089 [Serratia phage vB_SmaA_3M]AYP28347.1 hypothetical protein 3M_091 [Serratia phage vB_SmaA_3M]
MSRKGKRLTPDLLKSRIVDVQYEDREVLGQRMVTANFKMDNGFIVYGKKPSTTIDPAGFDPDMARKISYENTLEQLWELEAYRALSESALLESACGVDIDVFKYKIRSSELFEHYQHQTKAISLTFQPPAREGYITAEPFTVTMYHPNQYQSFEDLNNAVIQTVKDYLLKNIPADILYPPLIYRIAKTAYTAQYVYALAELDGGTRPWEGLKEEERGDICRQVIEIVKGGGGRFPQSLANKIFVAVVNSFK